MDLLTTAPNRGDIIWLDLNPKKGKEQKGHRPALVISHFEHNKAYGLAIIIPITRQVKGYGVEVSLPESCTIKGVLLSNQIQTIDWQTRNCTYETKLDELTIEAVILRIKLLIF